MLQAEPENGTTRLLPHPLEDHRLPAFAMEGESFPRNLEPLYCRQRVLHPLFLSERHPGWAARFRPRQVVKAQLRSSRTVSRCVRVAGRPPRHIPSGGELGGCVAHHHLSGSVGIAHRHQTPLRISQRIFLAARRNTKPSKSQRFILLPSGDRLP